MSEQTWKLEKDLCRCCHSEGSYRNLSESFTNDSKEEVLADMLQFTLDVNISPVPGDLCFVTYTVCDECIERIRDATNFKRQVLQCEQRFHTMYDNDLIKVPIVEGDFTVKDETPDRDTGDIISDIHHMDSDDDFPMNCDDEDLKSDTETREETRKSKGKKTKSKESKAKKKPDRPKKKATGRVSNVKNSDAKKDASASLEDMTDYTVVKERDKIKYSCNRCFKILSSAYTMKTHIVCDHFNILAFKCPVCDTKFKHKDTMTHHLVKAHGMEEVKIDGSTIIRKAQKYICDVCKKELLSRNAICLHISMKHRLINCPECSVALKKKELALHRDVAHGVPLPTCGVCGYKNVDKLRVLIHQRKVHLKEKNIPCPHCEAKFFNRTYLNRHLISHNPSKIYECSYCNKKFPRLTTLRTHEKIHTGDKRKICTICDERFVQKASLNYHLAKHHPEAC